MGTIFLNLKNSKTFEPYRLLLNLSDKKNLKRSNKYFALSNLNTYYTWKIIKKLNTENKFILSAPTWKDEFDGLLDGSYSISDIQDYFVHIIKNHERLADNPPIQTYVTRIGNKCAFKICKY